MSRLVYRVSVDVDVTFPDGHYERRAASYLFEERSDAEAYIKECVERSLRNPDMRIFDIHYSGTLPPKGYVFGKDDAPLPF